MYYELVIKKYNGAVESIYFAGPLSLVRWITLFSRIDYVKQVISIKETSYCYLPLGGL